MIVCDLDDTLCDARWRAHLYGSWSEYYADADLDKAHQPLARMLRAMIRLDVPLAVVSPRDEVYRPMTVKWLLKHDIIADDVLLRPKDNFMSNAELKLHLTADFHDEIELVIDSREDVLAAFRSVTDAPMMLWIPGPQRP